MNRSARKHRSTKVPNVKLRPAPASHSERGERRRQEQEAEEEDRAHYRRLREAGRAGKRSFHNSGDSEEDEEEEEDADDDKAPLLGCVICMTGIGEEKVKLTEYAVMLGAQVQGNLTEDATHLIANEPRSDKYRCALKLGLPILRPEWLSELRARWTEAVEYDFDGLMQEHRLDTFENLVVALAGVTEPSERTEIRKQLKSGSAKTPTTFSLDGTFSHLICGDIKDSKTMEIVTKFRRKAERFLRRGESLPEEGEPYAVEMKAATSLRMVWKEWVQDCLEVSGSIDEHYYAIEEPRMTAAQRKELKESILHEKVHREEANRERMAVARRMEETKDGKRARTEVTETPGLKVQEIQRVIKRPKVDMSQYVQQIQRAEAEEASFSDAAPSSTITGAATNLAAPALARARPFRQEEGESAPLVQPISPVPPPQGDTSLKPTGEQPSGDGEEDDEEGQEMQLEEDPAAGLQWQIREKGLQSIVFRVDLRDEGRNRLAHKALQDAGVKTVDAANDSSPAHFHILPLGKVNVSQHSGTDRGVAVTHLFVERCLSESRVLDFNESFALQPAITTFPLPGANEVCIALTGFLDDDGDRRHVELALSAAGIETSSTLKRGLHTHLLVAKGAGGSGSSQTKMQRAKEWGIPCVGSDFIHQIYRHGKIEPGGKRVDRLKRLLGQSCSRAESMGAIIGETQVGETQRGNRESHAETRPLALNEQVSNKALSTSRPWQRSASSSQAMLDGEQARGLSFSHKQSHLSNNESLEAGALASKTSTEVMALLSNRNDASARSSSSSARKRIRQPPSHWRGRRAGSAAYECEDQTSSGAMTAEELLGRRQAEEKDRQGLQGQTQINPLGLAEEHSMRITYEDPSSRRERRKLGEMVATSVKERIAQQEEAESTRSSSTEVEEDFTPLRTSSLSPTKSRSALSKPTFSPSIQARRQPGTSIYRNP